MPNRARALIWMTLKTMRMMIDRDERELYEILRGKFVFKKSCICVCKDC